MTTNAFVTAEFDAVFDVREDGEIVDRPDVYAPSVWHDDTNDVEIDGQGWEPLKGWTGQYGYHGACMHASETFAGGLAEHVASTPGTYVLVVVEVLPTEDDEEPEPAGWAILRKNLES